MAGPLEQIIWLIFLIGLLTGCIAALLALSYTVFPNLVGRARGLIERMPVRSFLVGLINFLFFGVITAALFSAGRLPAPFGLLIGFALFSFITLGLSAVALLVGERLLPKRGSAPSQVAAGAVVMALASAVPVIGWFVLPALAAFTGLGAVIIALVERRRTER